MVGDASTGHLNRSGWIKQRDAAAGRVQHSMMVANLGASGTAAGWPDRRASGDGTELSGSNWSTVMNSLFTPMVPEDFWPSVTHSPGKFGRLAPVWRARRVPRSCNPDDAEAWAAALESLHHPRIDERLNTAGARPRVALDRLDLSAQQALTGRWAR